MLIRDTLTMTSATSSNSWNSTAYAGNIWTQREVYNTTASYDWVGQYMYHPLTQDIKFAYAEGFYPSPFSGTLHTHQEALPAVDPKVIEELL